MNFLIIAPRYAPVAKLDKAPVYETGDYKFESCQVHHDLANRALSSFSVLPQTSASSIGKKLNWCIYGRNLFFQLHHDLAKRALSSFAVLPQNIRLLD